MGTNRESLPVPGCPKPYTAALSRRSRGRVRAPLSPLLVSRRRHTLSCVFLSDTLLFLCYRSPRRAIYHRTPTTLFPRPLFSSYIISAFLFMLYYFSSRLSCVSVARCLVFHPPQPLLLFFQSEAGNHHPRDENAYSFVVIPGRAVCRGE